MVKSEETTKQPAAPGELPDPALNEKAAERTDHLANGLERLAFKLHDFGNWLMGFIR